MRQSKLLSTVGVFAKSASKQPSVNQNVTSQQLKQLQQGSQGVHKKKTPFRTQHRP